MIQPYSRHRPFGPEKPAQNNPPVVPAPFGLSVASTLYTGAAPGVVYQIPDQVPTGHPMLTPAQQELTDRLNRLPPAGQARLLAQLQAKQRADNQARADAINAANYAARQHPVAATPVNTFDLGSI